MSYVIDSYTKLLIPFDGTDADTADQTAATGQTISLEGNACLDTAQKKFGTASLLLDGTGDYATVPDHADWYFGADPFTIDFWFKPNADVDQGFCGQYTDASNYWYFYHDYNALVELNLIKFKVVTGGVTKAEYSWSGSGLNPVFNHIELSRNGTNVYLFVNGYRYTPIIATAISTNEVLDSSGVLEIGASFNHTVIAKGWIDEFRISKGIARHTVNFIPHNEADFLGMF